MGWKVGEPQDYDGQGGEWMVVVDQDDEQVGTSYGKTAEMALARARLFAGAAELDAALALLTDPEHQLEITTGGYFIFRLDPDAVQQIFDALRTVRGERLRSVGFSFPAMMSPWTADPNV